MMDESKKKMLTEVKVPVSVIIGYTGYG